MASDGNTPLDVFFLSYQSFRYDPSLPPSQSYRNLRRYKKWGNSSSQSKNGWNKYQEALRQEFALWYGAETDLEAWHSLCRAVGISPLPETCQKCKKALRNTHVNLIDLIEHGRKAGDSGAEVRKFSSIRKLREYTLETRKIFKNDLNDKEIEGGVVLRHLLRPIFQIQMR